MVFILDTSSFRVLDNYFPDRFPSFWKDFDALVQASEILSAREVLNELNRWKGISQHLEKWTKVNKTIFMNPDDRETSFVAEIFAVRHFQQLVNRKQLLQGFPVADPFVIAMAKVRSGGCVVTEEKLKSNAASIPNVCDYFDKIPCCNFEGFMKSQGWSY